MSDEQKAEERHFNPAAFPFPTTNLNAVSQARQGQYCACPMCAIDWLIALVKDLHLNDYKKADEAIFSLVAALTFFWEGGRDASGVPVEEADENLLHLVHESLKEMRARNITKGSLSSVAGQSQARH